MGREPARWHRPNVSHRWCSPGLPRRPEAGVATLLSNVYVRNDAGEVVEEGFPDEGIEWRLNGKSHNEDPLFVFDEGTTIRMTLDNRAGPEHPFHLHG